MGLIGSLPDELVELTYLQRLLLNNNSINGTLPAAWFDLRESSASLLPLPNIYLLDLSENMLSGPIPETFWTLPLLSYVYLSDNLLTGPLGEPAVANGNSSAYPYLEHVWIQRNHLEGPAPFWMLDRFPMLQKLKLGGNHFTGQLPADNDGQVWPRNLTHFEISANLLTGPIPLNIFFVPSLLNLSLHTNLFTGTLMDTSGSFTSSLTPAPLAKVLLHSNLLTGTIPDTFGDAWRGLGIITLHNNSLTGRIDEQHCSNWPVVQEIRVDCQDKVTCTCSACDCSD
jgi:hypothetical protein